MIQPFKTRLSFGAQTKQSNSMLFPVSTFPSSHHPERPCGHAAMRVGLCDTSHLRVLNLLQMEFTKSILTEGDIHSFRVESESCFSAFIDSSLVFEVTNRHPP